MKCQIQNHHGQKFVTVCFDKECNIKQRLCCVLCCESHITHQKKWVEIDYLNEFIQQQSKIQVEYPKSCSYGQKQIIQGLEGLSSLIDSFQKVIKEKIEKIKQMNLQEYLKQKSNSQQGIEYWNKLLEGILEYIEIDNCLIKLTQSKEGQLSKIEESEIKIIKQADESMKSIINSINPTLKKIDNQTQTMKIGKLCFKENRKHPDIQIIDECTLKKINNNSDAMAFANEGFDPNNQSYQFAFNIQNIDSRYTEFFGVGNDENDRNIYCFNASSRQIGKGQYMISNTGYTYHSTDESLNGKENGMKFKTGDKIQIKYDHNTKMLEFRKSSDQNTIVKMPITDMTKKLYPCAYLFEIGGQV